MTTKVKRFSQDRKDNMYLYKCLIENPELQYKDFYTKNKSVGTNTVTVKFVKQSEDRRDPFRNITLVNVR